MFLKGVSEKEFGHLFSVVTCSERGGFKTSTKLRMHRSVNIRTGKRRPGTKRKHPVRVGLPIPLQILEEATPGIRRSGAQSGVPARPYSPRPRYLTGDPTSPGRSAAVPTLTPGPSGSLRGLPRALTAPLSPPAAACHPPGRRPFLPKTGPERGLGRRQRAGEPHCTQPSRPRQPRQPRRTLQPLTDPLD